MGNCCYLEVANCDGDGGDGERNLSTVVRSLYLLGDSMNLAYRWKWDIRMCCIRWVDNSPVERLCDLIRCFRSFYSLFY